MSAATVMIATTPPSPVPGFATGTITGLLQQVEDAAGFDRTGYQVALYAIQPDGTVGYQGTTGPLYGGRDGVPFDAMGCWTADVALGTTYYAYLVNAGYQCPSDSLPDLGGDVLSSDSMAATDDMPDFDTLGDSSSSAFIPFPVVLGADCGTAFSDCLNAINLASDLSPGQAFASMSSCPTENLKTMQVPEGVDPDDFNEVRQIVCKWITDLSNGPSGLETTCTALSGFVVEIYLPDATVVDSVNSLLQMDTKKKKPFNWIGLAADLTCLGINLLEPGMGTLCDTLLGAVIKAGGGVVEEGASTITTSSKISSKIIAWVLKEGVTKGAAKIEPDKGGDPSKVYQITLEDLDANITTSFQGAVDRISTLRTNAQSSWSLLANLYQHAPNTDLLSAMQVKVSYDYLTLVWRTLASVEWYGTVVAAASWPDPSFWTEDPQTVCQDQFDKDYSQMQAAPCYVAGVGYVGTAVWKLKASDDSEKVSQEAAQVMWGATSGSDPNNAGLSLGLNDPVDVPGPGVPPFSTFSVLGLTRVDIINDASLNWALTGGFQVRINELLVFPWDTSEVNANVPIGQPLNVRIGNGFVSAPGAIPQVPVGSVTQVNFSGRILSSGGSPAKYILVAWNTDNGPSALVVSSDWPHTESDGGQVVLDTSGLKAGAYDIYFASAKDDFSNRVALLDLV